MISEFSQEDEGQKSANMGPLGEQLTPIERKGAHGMRLLLQGHSVNEVAAELKLSPRTVETHLEKVKAKFQCQLWSPAHRVGMADKTA